jgi:hypothetical protein
VRNYVESIAEVKLYGINLALRANQDKLSRFVMADLSLVLARVGLRYENVEMCKYLGSFVTYISKFETGIKAIIFADNVTLR